MDELSIILDKAEKLFMHYGIKSVSMDDISREAGISKKTLYQHVDDKKDLVKKTISRYLNSEENACESICGDVVNPIEQLLMISSRLSSNLKSLNPSLFLDLQKFYPQSWALMNQHRTKFIYDQVKTNLTQGVEQGYYREDLNIEFVVRMYIGMVNIIMDPEMFPQMEFPFYKLTQSLMKYHFHAIASDKGMKYLEKLIQDKKE